MSFRGAVIADLAYCYRVYANGMHELVERLYGWDEVVQREKFVSVFRLDEARVICGRIGSTIADVGWIQVEAEANDFHVKELHIVSGSQNLGLGAWALNQVIEEATEAHRDVRLTALQSSPAIRFYHRLGFRTFSEEHMLVHLRRHRGA